MCQFQRVHLDMSGEVLFVILAVQMVIVEMDQSAGNLALQVLLILVHIVRNLLRMEEEVVMPCGIDPNANNSTRRAASKVGH